MRIAYICADPGVPIFGTKGCSIHVQEVVRALLRRGHSVDLFATRLDGEVPADLRELRLHWLPALPQGDLVLRERASLGANRSLASALQREGPFDAVYERYSLWSFAGMEYARACGTPGILEVNAPLIDEQARHRGLIDRARAEQVATRVFQAADAVVAVSEQVGRYVEEYPGMYGRVHVVPNGVSPERFPGGTRPSRPAPDGVFTVGFIGTLKPWHGLSVLTSAFALLHRREPRSRLLIVGDGPERSTVEAQLAQAGLSDAALLTGAVDPLAVPGLLASMDVAVAPYPAEVGFYFSPLKVFEYMAAGLPVIASRVGQLTQLLDDGVTGLLCPAGDPDALASMLDRVRADPALARRLGRAARAYVLRHHTWDAVVQRVLDLAAPPPLLQAHAAGERA